MREEFLTAILDGTLKTADIDPSVQWGLLGAGVGGVGSAIKSISGGDDFRTGLRKAVLSGLLGGGVGAGISAGTRLIGAKPVSPKNLAQLGDQHAPPSVAGSAGVGLLGAVGLGGLSEAREHQFRNKAMAEAFYGGKAKNFITPASSGKDGEKTSPSGKGGSGKKVSPEEKTVQEFLNKFRKSKGVRAGRKAAPVQELPGFFDRLMGRTNYSTEGLGALRKAIATHETAGKAEKATHLRGALKNLLEGEDILKMAPAGRPYLDPILKSVRSPKGLLAAGAGIGLTHLGISNLLHQLREKRK